MTEIICTWIAIFAVGYALASFAEGRSEVSFDLTIKK